MPEYTYTDDEGHEFTTWRSFHASEEDYTCEICGLEMYRAYQAPFINWGGLKPSSGEYHPEIQDLLDTKDERRAKFDEDHEAHEKRTHEEV
jgi:hypothetical protein